MASNGRILDLHRANMLDRVLHELKDAIEAIERHLLDADTDVGLVR